VLLNDEGFREAFERLATLPVALPAPIRKAFSAMSEARREELRQTVTIDASPFLRFQVAALSLSGNEADKRAATEILIKLASPEAQDEWDLFQMLLIWTEGCLNADAQKRRLPSASGLAATWIHAARLDQLVTRQKMSQQVVAFPAERRILLPL
jgi:hypothetical protein